MIACQTQIDAELRDAARFGWELCSDHEGRLPEWRLTRNGQTLFVSAGRHWLCCSLPVECAVEPAADLWRGLLEQSRRWYACKYSLDEPSQVLLQLEIPLDGFERPECLRAVEALSVYADRHREPVSQGGLVSGDSAGQRRVMVAGGRNPESKEFEVLPAETVALYFSAVEHQGWHLRPELSPNDWQAVYKGRERKFNVYLSFSRSWAYFQVPLAGEPGTTDQRSDHCRKALYRYLLASNQQIFWAKFGLDAAGQVLLMLDVPMATFELKRFRLAAETLARYADDFSYEIQIMSDLDRDPQLADTLQIMI